jgi:hypothetical protein
MKTYSYYAPDLSTADRRIAHLPKIEDAYWKQMASSHEYVVAPGAQITAMRSNASGARQQVNLGPGDPVTLDDLRDPKADESPQRVMEHLISLGVVLRRGDVALLRRLEMPRPRPLAGLWRSLELPKFIIAEGHRLVVRRGFPRRPATLNAGDVVTFEDVQGSEVAADVAMQGLINAGVVAAVSVKPTAPGVKELVNGGNIVGVHS